MIKTDSGKNLIKNQAVTEILGTMLLLSISIGLFSIVYISVLTVPQSPPNPTANIICQLDGDNIIVGHYGGKPLSLESKILLKVDDISLDPVNTGDYLYNDVNNDGFWSVGEKLVYSNPSIDLEGKRIEVNIIDIDSNSIVTSGIFSEGTGSILSINTFVDDITPYESPISPRSLTATGSASLDNVTLYYRWNNDNSSWDGDIYNENNNTIDNNISDEDGVTDKGIETNFVNVQDIIPDSDVMNIQEENIGGFLSSPVVETFSTAGSSGNVGSIVVNKPSGTVEGDLLVSTFSHDSTSGSLDSPPGWSDFFPSFSTDGSTFLCSYKIATASEPATYTFTSTDSDQLAVGIIRISGGNTTNPINAQSSTNSGSSNSPNCPSTTTTNDNTLVLRLMGADDGSYSSGSNYPSLHTGVYTAQSTGSFGETHTAVAYIVQASAGSTGSANFSMTESEEWGTITVAINPRESTNYEIDLEYQWTTAEYDRDNKEVCIYVDSHTGSENLNVNYRNGGSWTNLGTITDTGWNNFTAIGLTSSTYTIQLVGASESSDSNQDSWDIDCIYLYTWNSTSGPSWINFGIDISPPWSWNFNFPDGSGYYQFYSIGQKAGLPKECTPALPDAICRKI